MPNIVSRPESAPLMHATFQVGEFWPVLHKFTCLKKTPTFWSACWQIKHPHSFLSFVNPFSTNVPLLYPYGGMKVEHWFKMG